MTVTTLNALRAVATAITDCTRDIPLEKAESSAADQKVLLAVEVGYAPPRSADMSAYSSGYLAPRAVVGIGETGGSDDGKEASVPVMITVSTYSPGTARGDGSVELNNEGYIDLLLVLERIRGRICSLPVLGATTVDRPVNWGMYQDQPYPYWYGWISFDAKVGVAEAMPDASLEEFLQSELR